MLYIYGHSKENCPKSRAEATDFSYSNKEEAQVGVSNEVGSYMVTEKSKVGEAPSLNGEEEYGPWMMVPKRSQRSGVAKYGVVGAIKESRILRKKIIQMLMLIRFKNLYGTNGRDMGKQIVILNEAHNQQILKDVSVSNYHVVKEKSIPVQKKKKREFKTGGQLRREKRESALIMG